MKASFALMKKCSSAGRLTPKVALQLFDSFITPILLYGCEIWSNKLESEPIEQLHLKYLKLMLGVKTSTCNLAIYGETGRFPLHLTQMYRMIKYWLRLTQISSSKIVKQAFLQMKKYHDLGFKNWSSSIFSILSTYNMSHQWNTENRTQTEINSLLSSLKEQIFSSYSNSWLKGMKDFPKMRSYIIFKSTMRLEPYLLEIKNFKLRKLLSKFRLSSHDLEIEKGRYHKPVIPAEQRLCRLCNSNKVEDESHFILDCNFLQPLRTTLQQNLQKYNLNPPYSLQSIMSNTDTKCLFHIGKFLDKAFTLRQNALSHPNINLIYPNCTKAWVYICI